MWRGFDDVVWKNSTTEIELYALFRGPCVRKLLTGLIMYIYPLKIKNIVLYCIVLYCENIRLLALWERFFFSF